MEEDNTTLPKKSGLPWWVHICLAIASYMGIKHGVPAFFSGVEGLDVFVGVAPQLAPIIAIVFLLLAGVALYRDDVADEEQEEPVQDDEGY